MSYKILVINPGSTSTKLAIYEDEYKLFQENFEHDAAILAKFEKLTDQIPFRVSVIEDFLAKNNISKSTLSAVVGRGGLVSDIKGGGYIVNDDLATALSSNKYSSPHASNLGGLLAKSYADPLGINAYIYDAVTGGELPKVATITGFKEITRTSACHLLNSHAMAEKYASEIHSSYDKLNLIVAHLGGGISISAHSKGKLVDSIGDDDLHFSPERAGGVSLLKFLDLCFSEGATKGEIKKKIRGAGGMFSHLSTSDCRIIEDRISKGDKYAKLVYEAQAMQIAKSIGAISVVQKGHTDAIILTGGIAHSKTLTNMIEEYISYIADVIVMPGENEMQALALGILRILEEKEKFSTYKLPL